MYKLMELGGKDFFKEMEETVNGMLNGIAYKGTSKEILEKLVKQVIICNLNLSYIKKVK